jgi:hypothetical protein
MVLIQSVEALPGYRLRLGLTDGRTIEREFANLLAGPVGPMFEPLKDPAYFALVRVDPAWGTVVWPNGVDLDPDVLIWGGPPPDEPGAATVVDPQS